MMKGKTVVAVVVCVCLGAVTLMAAPINYHEGWDSYSSGYGGVNYVANWPTDPGPNRYEVEGSKPFVAPNDIKVRKDQTIGITHDLTTDALSAGEWVESGAGDPLVAQIYTWLNTTVSKIKYSDIFLEVSKGGVHAPSAGANPDVVAFGMTFGINGATTTPYVYDGASWLPAGSVGSGKAWNRFKLTITPTTLTLYNSKTGLSQNFTNNSNNQFDHLTVRTQDNDGAGQVRYADDVYLTGGIIVPEPGTLVLLSMGGLPLLLLHRRRI